VTVETDDRERHRLDPWSRPGEVALMSPTLSHFVIDTEIAIEA
jgi:hypothetical protein